MIGEPQFGMLDIIIFLEYVSTRDFCATCDTVAKVSRVHSNRNTSRIYELKAVSKNKFLNMRGDVLQKNPKRTIKKEVKK